MSRQELTRQVVLGQQEVMRILSDAAIGDLLEVELSMAQMKALAVVNRQPNCSMGMLSEQLGVKPPAASLLVDKLVRAGLAERVRDHLDGRRVIVQPTAPGAEMVRRIRQGQQSMLAGWVAELSTEDLAALSKGIRALAERARGFPLEQLAAPVKVNR